MTGVQTCALPIFLLDIRLPGLNGYEVCRALRDEFGQAIGIVFVSGSRTAAEDVSSGLLLGADDYVVKNCHPRELVARTRALARRVEAGGAATPGGRNLTRRELQILRLLADGIDERGGAPRDAKGVLARRGRQGAEADVLEQRPGVFHEKFVVVDDQEWTPVCNTRPQFMPSPATDPTHSARRCTGVDPRVVAPQRCGCRRIGRLQLST